MTAGIITLLAILSIAFAFGMSLSLTFLLLRSKILDRPNERSSHVAPTPRTGGLAVALTFLLTWLALFAALSWSGAYPLPPFSDVVSLALIALVVLAVSLIDDVASLSPLPKLGLQVAAAVAFAVGVAGLPVLNLPGGIVLDLGPAGPLVAVLWIVFFMNAFNFMDGINGIAAGSAIIACLFLSGAAAVRGDLFAMLTGLYLAASILGFFVFNFPRGRIFMGDNGSQFLGFMLAALSLWLARDPALGAPFFIVPLVFAPFIFDVVLTLIVRALRGQNVLEAHCDHVYQIATRIDWSHTQVSMAYFSLAIIGGFVALFLTVSGIVSAAVVLVAMLVFFAYLARAVYRTGWSRERVAPVKRPQ